MKKSILSFILCLTMASVAFSGFSGISSVQAAELDDNNYCADISGYRTGEKEDWTYPTKEGYVFAGWYTKKDFQQKYALTESMVSGGAYAKFVKEEVFSVKFQMNKLANVADEKMSLRMLTTVDDLTYQSAGFRFETGVISQEYTTTTVYTSILANDQEVFPNVFSEESVYILGHSVNDIPYYHYAAEFTMTPIIVTLDGTTVEGVSRSMNIMDDYTVMGDQTVTYNGGGTEKWWDTRVKIYAGQWVVFDVEGLTKDIVGQGVRLRVGGVGNEAYGDSNDGRKNTCIPDTDKMRYFIQFKRDYSNHELVCQLWANGAGIEGQEVKYTNIRILNDPEDAYFYKADEAVTDYVAPYFETLATSLNAKKGSVLSYKVFMEHGNLLNAGIGKEQKAWVYLNNGTTPVAASQVYQNEDGTQTVQFVLPEDATNFKPAFEIQNLNGATSNQITIEEIKILGTLDRENVALKIHNASAIDWVFGIQATAGQKYTFDIDTDRMLNVYAYYYKNNNLVGSGLVSAGVTHRGIQTIPATVLADCDQIMISLRDFTDFSVYTARICDFNMKGASVLSDTIRITCVGDSITQGVGASDQLTTSYPGQLQSILGDGYTVLNAGVAGTHVRANSSAPYIASTRYENGLAFNPDIVLIMLGTNDAFKNSFTAPELAEEFKRDYKALVEDYQALFTNPKIFLVLPTYAYDDTDKRQENLENYLMPVIREIAEEYNLDLIDMNTFTAGHSEWFPDGLHPGDVGYTQMAQEFSKYILAQ